MKYKITDSQLESVIFLYLDNQDFIKIERENSISLLIQKEMNTLRLDMINLMVGAMYIGR